MTKKSISCDTRQFFHDHELSPAVPYGECRRRAPRQMKEAGNWPQVEGHDWCGEWLPLAMAEPEN